MLAAAKLTVAFAAISAVAVDGAAERIALWAAGVTGIVLIWRNVVRPFGAIVKHAVHIVGRTARAVDLLEHLPERWRENDERLSAVEAEVGITHHELGQLDDKVVAVSNDVAAIRRDLGIEDSQVRSPPSVP